MAATEAGREEGGAAGDGAVGLTGGRRRGQEKEEQCSVVVCGAACHATGLTHGSPASAPPNRHRSAGTTPWS